MKTKLILLLLVVLTRAVFGVHNEVVEDMAALERAGFKFEKAEDYCTEKTITFAVQIPAQYFSDDYEAGKPFDRVTYIKPENPNAKGFELIGANGTHLDLAHRKEKTGNSVRVSVLLAEAPGAYLDFTYWRGQGHPPMHVYVPLKAIIAFLDKPAAEKAGGEAPAPAPGSKPEGKEKAQSGIPEAPNKSDPAAKESSLFDEFVEPKMPDFSKLPKEKRFKAEEKWYEENIGFGIPKTYMRFMVRLKKEAKLPPKDSKYAGIWGREGKSELVLSADGSFTWDYGHSKGVGIWREHSEGIIWIAFELTQKDQEGKETKFYAEHYCFLSKDGSLVQDHIDYTQTYQRQEPKAEAKPPK